MPRGEFARRGQRLTGTPGTHLAPELVGHYLVWGSTYLGIAYVIETLPPLTAMGGRFALAGLIVLIAVSMLRGRTALVATPAQLATAAASGVLLLLGGNGLVAVAQQGVFSGLAALLVACAPLWVVVLRALFGDRPALPTVGGVLLGSSAPRCCCFPAVAAERIRRTPCWSCSPRSRGPPGRSCRPGVRSRRIPFLLTSVQMLAGGTTMLAVGAVAGDWVGLDLGEVSRASWIALGYLVLFGSIVAFTAFAWLLQNAPVSQVMTYAYVNPVVAVALGALLRDEEVTGTVPAGGAIIVAAVAVVVSVEGRRRSSVAAAR